MDAQGWGVIITAIAAAVGWIFAWRASVKADTANREAAKSNLLAEQANRIAEKSAAAVDKSAMEASLARAIADRQFSWEMDKARRESTAHLVLKSGPYQSVHHEVSYSLTLENIGPAKAQHATISQWSTRDYMAQLMPDHGKAYVDTIEVGKPRKVELRGNVSRNDLYFLFEVEYQDHSNNKLHGLGIMPSDMKRVDISPTDGVLYAVFLNGVEQQLRAKIQDEPSRKGMVDLILGQFAFTRDSFYEKHKLESDDSTGNQAD